MTSTFTWLDYSEDARRRVLDAIDLFRERDTRDELGIGTIRDGFAGIFSPGTSTIQTRVRYFLLIPWLYQQVESARSTRSASSRARSAELDLIDVLLIGGDLDGLIGRQARHTLKRVPSSVYWQGLHTWRIRMLPVAQTAYHSWIDAGTAAALDLSEEGEPASGIWHAGLPECPAGFPEQASLTLRTSEADYLAERLLQYWPDTLLTWLLNEDEPLAEVDFPWRHPGIDRMPAAMREELDHAQCFSETIHGAQLLYNFMLARADPSNQPEAAESWHHDIEEWEGLMVERREIIASWDLGRFWEILDGSGARVAPPTRRFVLEWIERVRANQGELHTTQDEACKELVRAQEIQVKGGQARLANRSMLESWGGDSGSQQLNYRWGITRGYVEEIVSARRA